MADEEVPTSQDSAAKTVVGVSPAGGTGTKRSRTKKAADDSIRSTGSKPAKPKVRGLSNQEKLEKVETVEAAVADGATLKDAVKAAGISDQTYYQWKKATTPAAPVAAEEKPSPVDDELAEFIQLEEENRRLRKLLSEKLRSENADLRKRLGLS